MIAIVIFGAAVLGFIWGLAMRCKLEVDIRENLQNKLTELRRERDRSELEKNRAVDAFHRLKRDFGGQIGDTARKMWEAQHLGGWPAANQFTPTPESIRQFWNGAHKIPHRAHSDVLFIPHPEDLLK